MFQDFTAQHTPAASLGGSPPAAVEVAELLESYPNLSSVDLARLINLYRELSALDVALLISDETTGPRLDRFRGDHRSQIRTPFRQYAVLVFIAVGGLFFAATAAVLS